MATQEALALWSTCAEVIRAQVSDVVWHTTFNQAEPLSYYDGELVLSVPSAVVKERIEGRYLPMVEHALFESSSDLVRMVIEVRTPQPAHEADTDALLGAPPDLHPSTTNDVDLTDGLALDLTAEPSPVTQILDDDRFTFEDFVTGPSNRFAHAAALSVAETPARSYNPLFIYGDAGLGKTHLLRAIAQYVAQHYPHFRVLYVSSETFLNEFVEAIRNNTRMEFKRRYREIDVLLVDDIQFMEGKEGLQEEFFHTFNTLHQSNRQIVLSSDRPPDSIPTLEDRLRSRFKMGLITDIKPPDFETRLAILRKKGEHQRPNTPNEVLEFIASSVTDNIRELEGALIRVTAYANLTQEKLSVELAQRVLADILTSRQPRAITPDLILEKTADMFGFTVDEIRGTSRRRPLVTARQVAMYVCRELTDLSYPAIAREFGGRDHTTVIHAVEKIGALMSERRQIYDQVTELAQVLKSGG